MITRREIHFTPIQFALYLIRRIAQIEDPITPPRNPLCESLVSISRTRFEFVSWRERYWGFFEVMKGFREGGLLAELIVGKEGGE